VGHRRKRQQVKRFLEFNEYKNKTYQKQWDTAKAVLRGKFISINAYIKRTERSQISDLALHLKLLEKQEHAKPKTSRREIKKIRAEINEIETKKTNKKHTMNQWNEKLVFWKNKQDWQALGKSD
jgi:hypothetical protein